MAKDPRNELLNALKAMREDLREVTEGFLLCKEGEIEALCEYLRKMPATKIKDFTSPWLRKARDLKLKPAKGRIKDLKKIDGLLGSLLDSVIEADDLNLKPKPTRKNRATKAKAEADKQEIPSA